MSLRCPSEDRRLALGFLSLGVLGWLVPAGGRWVAWQRATSRAPIVAGVAAGWRGLLQGRPLDLNGATAEDLQTLPGVGPSTARAILADRGAHGPFRRVDDLTRVRGVGPKTLARLRPYLRVETDPVTVSPP